jgi:ribosomal protein L40E
MRDEKNNCSLCESCHATVKSEAIECARRCRSSQLTGKILIGKTWRAEEEKRPKGSLAPKNIWFSAQQENVFQLPFIHIVAKQGRQSGTTNLTNRSSCNCTK